MPRRRRYEEISEYHVAKIERQAWLLGVELRDAQLSLKPFQPHYDSISQLHMDMRRALNLLNGRPADYEVPHAAPMSRGGWSEGLCASLLRALTSSSAGASSPSFVQRHDHRD